MIPRKIGNVDSRPNNVVEREGVRGGILVQAREQSDGRESTEGEVKRMRGSECIEGLRQT